MVEGSAEAVKSAAALTNAPSRRGEHAATRQRRLIWPAGQPLASKRIH